jgi:adenine/guanine phosphoribosyltransferase-like PRPP-binding protein
MQRRSVTQVLSSGPPRPWNDVIAVVLGLATYALIVGWAHARLFGVPLIVTRNY